VSKIGEDLQIEWPVAPRLFVDYRGSLPPKCPELNPVVFRNGMKLRKAQLA
jgi:hypothetical protein